MKYIFIALVLFGMPSILLADDTGDFTATVEIGSVSSNLNTSNVINKFTALTPASSIDDNTSALLLSFSYRLDDYLSIGSDFITAGAITATESGTSYKLFTTETVSVYARIRSKLSERFTLYGKLGVHLWTLSENQAVPGGLDDSVDITYGIGTYINLYGAGNRQLNIQWNRYQYNGVYVEDQDVISLGILFIF